MVVCISSSWEHKAQEILFRNSYTGLISKYDGGGFVQNLSSSSRDESHVLIQGMRNSDWINQAARVIFIDVPIYNAQINLFCLVRFVLGLTLLLQGCFSIPSRIDHCIKNTVHDNILEVIL